MPAGAAIGAAAAVPALLPIQQAVPVEPADGETMARHPHAFGHGSPLVVDKTQRGDGQHVIEAGVGERQLARIAFHPVQCRVAVGTCVIQPGGIGVESGDAEIVGRSATRKPAGAAADIEQAVARLGFQMARCQRVFSLADPAPAWGVVPGVVVGWIHAGDTTRRKRRSMPMAAINAANRSGTTARFSVTQPKRS